MFFVGNFLQSGLRFGGVLTFNLLQLVQLFFLKFKELAEVGSPELVLLFQFLPLERKTYVHLCCMELVC